MLPRDGERVEVPNLKAPRLDPADAADTVPKGDVVQTAPDLGRAIESPNLAKSPIMPQSSESLNPLLNPLRAVSSRTVPPAKPWPTSLLGGAANSISVLRNQPSAVGAANSRTVSDNENKCHDTPADLQQEPQNEVGQPHKAGGAPPLWAQIIGDDDNEDDELSLSDDEDY